MMTVRVNDEIAIGDGQPLALIGGPCAIESEALCLRLAAEIASICKDLGIAYIFKASFDKANRLSLQSPRGVGLDEGLAILKRVRDDVGVPVLTDIHETWQAQPTADVAAILQIPAFLCRQTDLLLAAGATQSVVNVKKAQFMAPRDLAFAAEKVQSTGNDRILLTERGTSFGYCDLVVDFRGLAQMRQLGYPVVFDATHSVQQPGALDGRSGGQRQYVPALARAAVAVGVDALFMEIHEDPDRAVSDGPNMVPMGDLRRVLESTLALHDAARAHPAPPLR